MQQSAGDQCKTECPCPQPGNEKTWCRPHVCFRSHRLDIPVFSAVRYRPGFLNLTFQAARNRKGGLLFMSFIIKYYLQKINPLRAEKQQMSMLSEK